MANLAFARCVALVVALQGGVAHAEESVSEFYAGKQIRLVISTSAGGLYDVFARLLARHLGDHIPGRPAMVVQNMPGASGIVAANFIANAAPRDGTALAAVQSNVPTADALRMEGVRFKGAELSWIGSMSQETFVGYVHHTSKIHKLDDTLRIEGAFGGPSLGSASIDMSVIARSLFGFKLRIVNGYPGGAETKLAIEKGEIDGSFATGWAATKNDQPEWIRDGLIRVIVQHGLTRNRELPDVPLLLDWAKTPQDQELVRLLMARTVFAKPFFMPPGVPADRLQAVRRAFDETLRDKDFLADAKRINVTLEEPMTGEAVAAAVADFSRISPAVVDRIEAIFRDFSNGK